MEGYSTLPIKKCPLKSLNAGDRPGRILTNTRVPFLKADKSNQYLIHVPNEENGYINSSYNKIS